MARATPMPADERRAAIMAATEPLVVLYGREVSTRQIAEAAGIAEGTIFRVFPNKDAVVDAIIEDAFDSEPAFLALSRIDPAADLAARLAEAVAILEARMRRVVSLFAAFRHTVPPPDHTRQTSTGHGASPPQPLDRESDERRSEDGESDDRATRERRRQRDNARLTTALVEVIGADADRLRLPAGQVADLIRGLVFTVTHPVIGASFPSEPSVVVDILLRGILTPTHQESHPC